MGGDQQPWPDEGARVDRIAQVDGGPVRVGAAEIAQSGESAIEVVVCEPQRGERLGGRGVHRLGVEGGRIQRQVHVAVDESRGGGPGTQIEDAGTRRSGHGGRYLADHPVTDQDLGRSRQGIRATVEIVGTHQHGSGVGDCGHGVLLKLVVVWGRCPGCPVRWLPVGACGDRAVGFRDADRPTNAVVAITCCKGSPGFRGVASPASRRRRCR